MWRPGRKHLPESWRGRFLTLGTYSPLWSGGLLLLAAPLLLVRRLPRNVRLMAVAGLIATFVWTVIEFGKPAADAVTHQGPYAAFLLIDVALAAAVARLLPRWVLAAVVGLQIGIWSWLMYVLGNWDHCLVTLQCEGHHFPNGTVREGQLVLPLVAVGVLGFAAFVATTLWLEPSPPDAGTWSTGRARLSSTAGSSRR